MQSNAMSTCIVLDKVDIKYYDISGFPFSLQAERFHKDECLDLSVVKYVLLYSEITTMPHVCNLCNIVI